MASTSPIEDIIHKRLDEHDKNRVAVQERMKEIHTTLLGEIDKLEESACGELEQAFEKEDEKQQELIQEKINGISPDPNRCTPHLVRGYTVIRHDNERAIDKKITIGIEKAIDISYSSSTAEDIRAISEEHSASKVKAAEKVLAICNEFKMELRILDEMFNTELEEKFTTEDKRLQSLLMKKDDNDSVIADLVVGQFYYIEEDSTATNIIDRYNFKTKRNIPSLDERTKKLGVKEINNERVYLTSKLFSKDEQGVLEKFGLLGDIESKVTIWEEGKEPRWSDRKYDLGKDEDSVPFNDFRAESPYYIQVVTVHKGERTYQCEPIKFVTPELRECCVWKKCPKSVDHKRKYSVNLENPRVATSISSGDRQCTIIGNTYLPLNKVTSWSIKVSKAKNNKGDCFIGVTPFRINQNDVNYNRYGWYFDCYNSSLCSGPPHDYSLKEYGPRKEKGEYVHTGDSVGIIMDTTKGDLSFVLNGVNLGVAYEGIPLNDPLVPCVLLSWKDDTIEFNTSRVESDIMDSSIPTPSNITAKNATTWDSIILTWDKIDDASFYQIEVDESNSWGATTINTFTKGGLLSDTEYTFRVRAVRGNLVSEWSDVAKGKTLKEPEFSESAWKECPDDVDERRKYVVAEENPRIATKVGDCYYYYGTIIGNASIPLNKLVSWNVEIVRSKKNDGGGIYVGVAPLSINQNNSENYNKCGWYFNCYSSALCSGPPQKYKNSKYKSDGWEKRCMHTGDNVGVVMNTKKGDLSFVLNGVNLGIAYEKIPLDKPLVPCVLLEVKDDSVKFNNLSVNVVEESSNAVRSDASKTNAANPDATKASASTSKTKRGDKKDKGKSEGNPDKDCIIS